MTRVLPQPWRCPAGFQDQHEIDVVVVAGEHDRWPMRDRANSNNEDL
jgi:hypothetical protein